MWKPHSKSWMSTVQQLSASPLLRKGYEFLSRVPVFGPALQNSRVLFFPQSSWYGQSSAPVRAKALDPLNPRFEMEYVEGNYEPTVWRVLQSHFRSGGLSS